MGTKHPLRRSEKYPGRLRLFASRDFCFADQELVGNQDDYGAARPINGFIGFLYGLRIWTSSHQGGGIGKIRTSSCGSPLVFTKYDIGRNMAVYNPLGAHDLSAPCDSWPKWLLMHVVDESSSCFLKPTFECTATSELPVKGFVSTEKNCNCDSSLGFT